MREKRPLILYHESRSWFLLPEKKTGLLVTDAWDANGEFLFPLLNFSIAIVRLPLILWPCGWQRLHATWCNENSVTLNASSISQCPRRRRRGQSSSWLFRCLRTCACTCELVYDEFVSRSRWKFRLRMKDTVSTTQA